MHFSKSASALFKFHKPKKNEGSLPTLSIVIIISLLLGALASLYHYITSKTPAGRHATRDTARAHPAVPGSIPGGSICPSQKYPPLGIEPGTAGWGDGWGDAPGIEPGTSGGLTA